MECFTFCLFVFVVLTILAALCTAVPLGAVYGAGIAVRNYVLAFAENVKREKVPHEQP